MTATRRFTPLVLLIGASGSGKSTFARKHFKPTEVVSSDVCRGIVSDDENDQAVTPQGLPGTGHLNPDYLEIVLHTGGRYICGDPNSLMPVWLQPVGPLNYREIEEIITFIVASNEVSWTYQEESHELGATPGEPVQMRGWRDPNYSPPPDATPVPACWRAPAGTRCEAWMTSWALRLYAASRVGSSQSRML